MEAVPFNDLIAERPSKRKRLPVSFRSAAYGALWLPLWLPILFAIPTIPTMWFGSGSPLFLILLVLLAPLVVGGPSFLIFAMAGTVFIRKATPKQTLLFSLAAPLIHAPLLFILNASIIAMDIEILINGILPGISSISETGRMALLALPIGYIYVGLAWGLLLLGAMLGWSRWIDGQILES